MASYKNIAKSSGLIACVQIVQMIFSLFRNKVISLILGSGAFGLYSIYTTFIEMGSVFAVFGLNNSVVRELSRCGKNKCSIGKVYYISNRLILISSTIICILILLFAKELSYYIFNEYGHEDGVRCVAFLVILMVIAKEGYAILNGIRSLRKLAVSQIVGSGTGSIGIIFAILLWKSDAIPASLGFISATVAIVTYIFIRKEGVREVKVTWNEFKSISRILLSIGAGVTVAGIMSTVMTLMSKSYLTEHYTISAVGFYQASWTISNLYTGIILSAMGVDFMPRLSRVIDDNKKATEMINQQIVFGVVLSSIAITGILLFSKEILYILYAEEFKIATTIVKWHIVGVFLRVIAFPFSYTILAKGNAKFYATAQIIFWTGDYILLMLCSSLWGFEGLGVNYPIAYLGYLLMTYFAAKRICCFAFSKELIWVIIRLCGFILVALLISSVIDNLMLYYAIACLLLICHIHFVSQYLKHKMDINIYLILKKRFIKNEGK